MRVSTYFLTERGVKPEFFFGKKNKNVQKVPNAPKNLQNKKSIMRNVVFTSIV